MDPEELKEAIEDLRSKAQDVEREASVVAALMKAGNYSAAETHQDELDHFRDVLSNAATSTLILAMVKKIDEFGK